MGNSSSDSPDRNERQPLLREAPANVPLPRTISDGSASSDVEGGIPSSSPAEKKKQTSALQILLICIYRTVQPMFFIVVAPYINQMLVEDLRLSDEMHVGQFSGKVESAAAVGMCVGILLWSALSDKYGRKPIILIGVTMSCMLSAAFGFARRFWLLLLIRFGMGFGAGAQGGTSKVMVSEISDTHSLAQNFVYLSVAWQIGCTTGPLFGGVLARPAKAWPGLFKHTIFDSYPYALPTIAVTVLPALSVIVGILFLKETGIKKPSSGQVPPPQSTRLLGVVRNQTLSSNIAVRTYRTCVETFYPSNGLPPLGSCGAYFMFLVTISIVFQEVALSITELLFLFSSRKIGGLGLTQGQIATYCTIRPMCIFLYEMNCYNKVSKLMGGTIPLLKRISWIYPVIYMVYLLVSQLALLGELTTFLVLLGLATSLVLQIIANSSHICQEVLMMSRAPTQEQLSTISAIYEIAGQCGVGTAAVFSSSLFAESASMHDGFFRFKLVWIVSAGVAVINALLIRQLTHIEGWKGKQPNNGRVD